MMDPTADATTDVDDNQWVPRGSRDHRNTDHSPESAQAQAADLQKWKARPEGFEPPTF
jgi:hypothetical protein